MDVRKKKACGRKHTVERITKQNRGVGSYANGKCETGCMDNDEMKEAVDEKMYARE